MAQFYGSVHGNRKKVSRFGTKASDMQTIAASWEGCVKVVLSHDAKRNQDMATVSLETWHGAGTSKLLFFGPVSGEPMGKEGGE